MKKLVFEKSLVLGVLAVLCLRGPAPAQVEVGAPAPVFEAEWMNFKGAESLADLRGRVVLIEFWRTW